MTEKEKKEDKAKFDAIAADPAQRYASPSVVGAAVASAERAPIVVAAAPSGSMTGRFAPDSPSAFDPGGSLYNAPSSGMFGAGGGSRQAAREAKIGLDQERLGLDHMKFQAGQTNEDRNFRAREALAAENTAVKAYDLSHKRQTFLDTAGFITKLKDIRPEDPDFDTKIAAAGVEFPLGPGSAQVQSMLASKGVSRKALQELTAKGGAAAYSPQGAEVFNATLKQTGGDVNAAHAQTKVFEQGEKDVLAQKAAGFLTDEDFASRFVPNPDGTSGKMKNPIFRTDPNDPLYGAPDHAAILKLAASRSGAQKSKTSTTAQDNAHDLAVIKEGRTDEPGQQKRYDAAQARQTAKDVAGAVDPRIALATRALEDPNASPAHKAAAAKILRQKNGK